nr:MAG TPA: hypothetical protein [Caudoviricetes sp.]
MLFIGVNNPENRLMRKFMGRFFIRKRLIFRL